MAQVPDIRLNEYSAVVISISGGKDSQGILRTMVGLVRDQEYAGSVVAVHADTGGEWPQSLPHCRMLCNHYGIPLEVALPVRPLPEHIERRAQVLKEAGKDEPAWPSSACRYCTSDCKRDPIHKVVRGLFPQTPDGPVLSVTGERRQESAHRAKLPFMEEVKRLRTAKRTVMGWRPILDWSLDEVWADITASGLPRHVAYDRGNERLSCALCVLAKDADIRNGALECPELALRYLALERETGFTFKNGKSLKQILEGPDHAGN